MQVEKLMPYLLKGKMVGVWMTASFDLEYQKKLTKVREGLSKREVEVRKQLANIEKIRVEALKKTEEMKYSAQHDIERIDQDVMKAKNLDAQTKARLAAEISTIKSDVDKKYSDLRSTILSEATLPQS
jgi:multidrug resistance efflux pump